VVAAGVVGHQVDDHPQPQLVGARHQGVGVGQGAEQGVDGAVVGHVVPRVVHRAGVERRQPQRIHAEFDEVIQAGGDARQVTDAVAVGVGPAARIDLVDHGAAPPGTTAVGRVRHRLQGRLGLGLGLGVGLGIGLGQGHLTPCG